MNILITESQYKKLMEQEEQKVLYVPDVKVFGGWNNLQNYLKSKGNPPYSIGGDLDLSFTHTRTLGNLQFVGGNLDLANTDIQYLWKLKSVGGDLILRNDEAVSSLGFFGDLKYVGEKHRDYVWPSHNIDVELKSIGMATLPVGLNWSDIS